MGKRERLARKRKSKKTGASKYWQKEGFSSAIHRKKGFRVKIIIYWLCFWLCATRQRERQKKDWRRHTLRVASVAHLPETGFPGQDQNLLPGQCWSCSRLAPWWIEFCFWLRTSRDRTGKYNQWAKYVFAKSQLDRTLDLFCVQVKLKICLCVIVPGSVSSRVHFTAQTRLVSDDDWWENLRRQHLYQHLSNWSQFVPIHFYHFTLFTIILQYSFSSFRLRLSSVPKWNCAFSPIC